MSSPLADIQATMVNFETIEQYYNKTVVIYGTVDSVSDECVYVKLTEGENKKISVNNFVKSVNVGDRIKVIGTAMNDKSLNYIDCILINDEIDLTLANQVAGLMAKKDLEDFF